MKLTIFLVLALGLTSVTHAQFVYNENYKRSLDEQYTTGLFKGNMNSYMLVPPDDALSPVSFSIFQYLQGRIPGLIIYNNWPYTPSARWRNGTPAYFLNEIRVDAQTLAMVGMQDIGLVKVFRPPFMGAAGGGGSGAIAVYTLRGDEEEID
jgi:hypothetical protein